MSKFKPYFLPALVIFFITSDYNTQQYSISASKGTLILITCSKEGLVIVADKRMLYNGSEISDTSIKISQVGKFIGFSITGAAFYFDTRTKKSIYDANSLVKRFFTSHQSIVSDTLALLSSDLVNDFQELLNTHSYNDWPNTSNLSDSTLYYIVFYFFNKELHKFQMKLLRFVYIKQFPKPEIYVQEGNFSDSLLLHTYPIIIGNNLVYKEITEGVDKRFDDLRSNSDIKKYLTGKKMSKIVSSKKVITFSTFFIKECSKRDNLIPPFLKDISPTVDIAIIDSVNGFKWVGKNIK